MKSISKNFKQYIQYDTDRLTASAGVMSLILPKDDYYIISLDGIEVVFANNFVPDAYSGYIRISGMQTPQYGNAMVAGLNKNSQGGIIYPMGGVTENGYRSKVENKVFLHVNEFLTIEYLNADLSVVATSRLVMTILIQEASVDPK